MKKINKNLTIQEQVGDTSELVSIGNSKKKKITIIGSLIGLVLMIVISIFIFATPTKVVFVNQYSSTGNSNEHFIISKQSGLLNDGPKDPTRKFYDFGGWYLTNNFNGDPLFNNDENKNLLEYKFSTSKKSISLYAKWVATEYTVEYNVKGEGMYAGNFSETFVGELNDKNSINPSTYSVKHEIQEFEREQFVEKLRKENPSKYVNSPDAFKNIQDQLEIYTNELKRPDVVLKPLAADGWEFLGWFDEQGNKVEKLDKIAPFNIKLTARWEQK